MPSEKKFAVCVDNSDYPAALEIRKVYQVLPDPAAVSRSYLRIIDESGEDYLYPSRMFLQVKVGPEGRKKLVKVLSFSKPRPQKSLNKAKRQRGANLRQGARRLRSSKRSKREMEFPRQQRKA